MRIAPSPAVRHGQARAVGADRERVGRGQQRSRRRSRRRPGRCSRRRRRAGRAVPVAGSRCRIEMALPVAGGDVDVTAAGGDRERRGLRERAARRAAEAAGEADAAGRAGLLRERAGRGVALQDGDGVGILGGRVQRRRRRARWRAHRRPRARGRRCMSPASPPRMQACLPPSCSSAPPVGSIANDGDGVGVAAGHVEAAAVGRDRERGRAEQADAGGAAAEAARAHAPGRALELGQRARLDVTREAGDRVRDRRDGVEVAAARARARSGRRR